MTTEVTPTAQEAQVYALARSRNNLKRTEAARSRHICVEDLVQLALKDSSHQVRIAAWGNDRFPRDMVDAEIARIGQTTRKNPNGPIVQGLLGRRDLTAEELLSIGTPGVLRHPNYPMNKIVELLSVTPSTATQKQRRREELDNISRNPNLSEEVQLILCESKDERYRSSLARCNNLSLSVVEIMRHDSSPNVLYLVARSDAAAPYRQELADRIRRMDCPSVSAGMACLLVQYSTDKQEVLLALNHSSPNVVREALKHPLLAEAEAEEAIASMAYGRNRKWRKFVANHPDAPDEYKVVAALTGF